MAKIIPISEHFQHFLAEMKDEREFLGRFIRADEASLAAVFRAAVGAATRSLCGLGAVRTAAWPTASLSQRLLRAGFCDPLRHLRLRVARTREKSFLPRGLQPFQRRAEEVSLLIREAFLRGISTRQVGRVVATLTGEVVSAQTVSKLTRDLDEAVRQFHQAQLSDDYAYLFLDGVSLRVRRPAGRKRVQMLVAYGVRRDGRRHLLAFLRSQGESQADWESLLQDLYAAGWKASTWR